MPSGGGGQTVVSSGGGPSPEAARIAGEFQIEGIEKGTESAERQLQLAIEELQRQESVAREDIRPFREAGVTALGQLEALAGTQGATAQQAALDAIVRSPATQFRIEEGQRALERSAAAQGILESGQTAKALTEFGQGIATDEIAATQGRLAQLAGFGGTAAGQTAQGALGTGAGVAGIQSNLGQTLANAAIASGNALASSHLLQNQQPAVTTTSGGGGGLGGIGSLLGGLGSLFGGFF